MPRLHDRAIRAMAAVTVVAACLGFWLLAWRGIGLFALIGACSAIGVRTGTNRAPRLTLALAFALAAAAIHASATLGWGGADAPDGTRYKASSVGLSHVLEPRQPVSATNDCGWYAASGYEKPCAVAPGGAAAFAVLRLVYPLLLAAAAMCGLGVLLSWRGAASAGVQRRLGTAALCAAIVAVACFAGSLGGALAPLEGLEVGVGGTLGVMLVTVAIVLCLSISLAPAIRGTPAIARAAFG